MRSSDPKSHQKYACVCTHIHTSIAKICIPMVAAFSELNFFLKLFNNFWTLKKFLADIESFLFDYGKDFLGNVLSELNPQFGNSDIICPGHFLPALNQHFYWHSDINFSRNFLSASSPWISRILTEALQEVACQNWTHIFCVNSERNFPGNLLPELSPYFFWILTAASQDFPVRIEPRLFFEFWQKLSKKFPVRIACFGDHSDRKFPGKFLSELLKFVLCEFVGR